MDWEPENPIEMKNLIPPIGYIYAGPGFAEPLIKTDHGWMSCIGQLLMVEHYPELAKTMGETWYINSVWIRLPDCRDRVISPAPQSPSHSPKSP